jgi:serine/threonine protein kinase
VGSPHYIAPEVANDDPAGYDGRKVDMWSAGIIFYSMFTTSLPFGSDLHNCVRYKRFREWLQRDYAIAMKEGKEFQIPIWFWPTHISPLASDLLIKLLQTDPTQRITAAEALRHPWCRVGLSTPDDNLQPGSSCPTPILQNALHDNMHLELGETGVPLSTAMSVIANEHDEQMHDPDSGVPSKPTAAPAGLTHKMLSQDPNGTNFTTTGNNNNITNSINKNERTPTAPVSRQLFSEAIGTAPNGPGTSLPVTSLLSASLANVQTNPGAYATQSAANPTIYDNSHSSAGPKLRHLQQPSVQVNHVTGTTNQPEQQQQKPSQQQQTSQSSGWQYDREAILQQQRQKEAEVLALYQLQHQQQLVQQQANAQRLQQPPQSPYVHYQQENGQIAISPHVPFQSSPLLFVQQHQHQHQQHSEQANFFLARPAPSGSLAQYSVSSSFGSSPLAGSPPFLYPSQAQLVMNRSEHGSTMEIAAPVASMMVDDGSLQSSGGFVENQQSSLPQRHGHISKMMTMEVDATYESTTSSKYPPRPPQYKSDALGDGSGPAILSPAGMSHVSVTSPANSVMAGQYLQSKEASLLLR